MMISAQYLQTLRARVVQDFVEENDRAPTAEELTELMVEQERIYAEVDNIGISGYDVQKPQFEDASSVADENKNRRALMGDLLTISQKIEDLKLSLEDGFRGFQGQAGKPKGSPVWLLYNSGAVERRIDCKVFWRVFRYSGRLEYRRSRFWRC